MFFINMRTPTRSCLFIFEKTLPHVLGNGRLERNRPNKFFAILSLSLSNSPHIIAETPHPEL